MKKSKFTEEQIAFALRQAQAGTRVEEVCRKFGVSQATFYNWKRKYGGLGVSELRRLKQLEAENVRLKKLVADLSLDKEMLQTATGATLSGLLVYLHVGKDTLSRRAAYVMIIGKGHVQHVSRVVLTHRDDVMFGSLRSIVVEVQNSPTLATVQLE